MQRSARERFLPGVIPYDRQAGFTNVFTVFSKGGYRVRGTASAIRTTDTGGKKRKKAPSIE